MAKHKQPQGLAPGMYFNLPDDEYHADHALSRGGIKDILVSLRDFYDNSTLSPHRERRDSAAKNFGTQCHMFMLERDRFFKTYNVAGGKGGYKNPITLTSLQFHDIKESAAILLRDPATAQYFQHGYPEVTIIWIDPATGVRLRARIDYLRTFGGVDIKRLKSILKKHVGWQAVDHGYDIQDFLYREAIKQAKLGLRRGDFPVHGDVDPEWLEAFKKDDDTIYVFFLQRSVKPYIYRILNFTPDLRAESEVLTRRGIAKYKDAIQKYGVADWPYGSAVPENFGLEDIPRRTIDS